MPPWGINIFFVMVRGAICTLVGVMTAEEEAACGIAQLGNKSPQRVSSRREIGQWLGIILH